MVWTQAVKGVAVPFAFRDFAATSPPFIAAVPATASTSPIIAISRSRTGVSPSRVEGSIVGQRPTPGQTRAGG